MITAQFPLKSTEFLTGSPQYNEYISCLEKVWVIYLLFLVLRISILLKTWSYLPMHTSTQQNTVTVFVVIVHVCACVRV